MTLLNTLKSMVEYMGNRLVGGEPIRIPRTRSELTHLSRQEMVDYLIYKAEQLDEAAKAAEDPQLRLKFLKEAQTYRGMGNLLRSTIISLDLPGSNPE